MRVMSGQSLWAFEGYEQSSKRATLEKPEQSPIELTLIARQMLVGRTQMSRVDLEEW